jgi:uncharacterized HAD superfamily protein
MNTQRIGVDLDDVLIEFVDTFRIWYNQKFNTDFKYEDLNDFFLENVFNITKEQILELIFEFYVSPEQAAAPAVKGAVAGMQKLQELGYEVFVITARPEWSKEVTEVWLNTHFAGLYEAVYFVNHFGGGENKKKSEVCTELGLSIFVDDAIYNITEIIDNTQIKAILVDKPWNHQDPTPEGAKRVFSWEEIVENIK